jgi:hypothetical protein
MTAAFRRRYGASPLHLLASLAAIALGGWAALQALSFRAPVNWLVWLVGGALLHDLFALPLYSALDRLAARVAPVAPAVNYVRVPAVVSGTLLLVYFPLILHRAPANVERVAGRTPQGVTTWWAAITAALFLGSALLYALRARRSGVQELQHAGRPSRHEDPPRG